MKQLRFALEISPDDAVLQSMLAVKLGAYKKYKEAEDLLNKALKTDPDNPHVSRYIGKYFRNQVCLNVDSYPSSLGLGFSSSRLNRKVKISSPF